MDFQIPDKDLLTSVDRATDSFLVYDDSASSLKRTTVNYALDLTSHPVGVDDSQTLTLKTLTAPNISSPVLSGTVTGTYTLAGTPTFPSSVVTLTGSQTLTNKVLTSPTINTATINNPTLNTDTVSEFTVGNGVTIDGLNIKDGKLNTNNSVGTDNITNAAISNAKLKSGAGEPAGSWDSWSCTTTNITLGTGGSIVTTYKQIGKTVHFYIRVQLGTGGSLGGQPIFSPPVTMHSKYNTGNHVLGLAWYEDSGIGNSIGLIWVTSGNIRPAAMGIGSSYANWSALSGSVPFTWSNGDYMVLASTYEAA